MPVNAKLKPLHFAALHGDIQKVSYLIKGGANVNETNKDGETPLHCAALRGHLSIVESLLEKGATINQVDNKGAAPLHSAAVQGKVETVKFLLSKGGDLNKNKNNGKTALHLASWGGHFDVVQFLSEEGADLNVTDNLGESALHLAAREGNLKIIQYLLAQNAEVNATNVERNTVLHVAAGRGYVNVTDILLKHGANVNAATTEGETALHLAAEKGSIALVQRLLEGDADINKCTHDGAAPLHIAVQEGQLGIAKYLLANGSKVNISSTDGRTPLYLASGKGNLELTNFLLQEGANVNSCTRDGETALHFAAQEGYLDVIHSLYTNDKAVIEQSTSKGTNALHLAARYGHIKVVGYLCQQGIDVNKGDNEGATALHAAVQEGYLDVARLLIEQGAKMNPINAEGQTALHMASEKGYHEIVRCLLSQKSKKQRPIVPGHRAVSISPLHKEILQINLIDKNGYTASHLATRHGHLSIVETLLSYGADLNIQENNGQTCLHEATKQSRYPQRDVQATDDSDKAGKSLTLHKGLFVESRIPKQSSADVYLKRLPPKEALVFYLLDHGARPDVKDKEGNMPIQYIKDRVLKQMLISRFPQMKLEKSSQAELASSNNTSAVVGYAGKEIELGDHGITMSIPEGAVLQNDQRKITLTLLKDPPSLEIQKDESVACYGIRCDPPNITFIKPVKISIPHSTLFINPEKVTPDIVSSVEKPSKREAGVSRMRSSDLPDRPPYCRVHKRHLELYIDHCAKWWVLIPLEQQVVRHQLICTPYIPEKIERGRKTDIHLHVHTNIPGIEAEVQDEERRLGYHKVHRSVPFTLLSNSGDVTVTCDRGSDSVENKKPNLKEVRARMRTNIILSVSPSENNAPYEVITITFAQAAKFGVFRSFAFVIKYPDEVTRPIPETSDSTQELEDGSYTDLSDTEILEIAEEITLDQYYDLGVALGFTITQLDNMEYRRFRDRQQAIYDMLIRWKKNQPPGKHAKKRLRHAMKAADMATDQIPDIDSTDESQDKLLLVIARQIKSENYFQIGRNLGFERGELEQIEHRALSNRKDANIQMLGKWMKSQPSSPEAIQTLKLVWRSVQSVDTSAANEDQGFSSMSQGQSKSGEDIDQFGGAPTYEEICRLATSVSDMTLARDLGRALRLDDEVIVGCFDSLDSVNLNNMALKLFEGKKAISRKILSMKDLQQLAKQQGISINDILDVFYNTVTLSPVSLRQTVIDMLQEWIQQGGTRDRLLRIVQGFDGCSNAAEKIATEMKHHPGFVDFFSSRIIDHKGGILELAELDVRLSIPDRALAKGERYLMTLRVPCREATKIPLEKGEVLISPVVECSPVKHHLLKPASVFLPHCVDRKSCSTTTPDVTVITRKGSEEAYDRMEVPRQQKHELTMTEDGIRFQARHLQLFAVSSSNLRAVRFRCVAFQPIFMPTSQKPVLHLHFHNPYRKHAKEIERTENNAAVAYCQLGQAVKYSLQSTSTDLTIWCLHSDGGDKRTKRMIPIHGLQRGCVSVDFELHFLPREKGKKEVGFLINQGAAVLGKHCFTTSIEAEGTLQGVSDRMIESVAKALKSEPRKRSLGYQLGFSYFIVENYFEDDSSASDVSVSGCQRMLHHWRRRVRPAHQLDKLRDSLKKAQLGHISEAVLPEGNTGKSVAQLRERWEGQNL